MILKVLKKVPAGLMLVPLLLCAVIHTFFPAFFEFGLIGHAFGGTATNTLLGLFLIIVGSSLRLNNLGQILRRGGVLLLAKFAVGALLGVLFTRIFGTSGFLGISSLALICAVTSTNGTLYYGVAQDLGDEIDVAAIGILIINNSPFLTMLVLGVSGLASFDFKALFSMLLPLLIGMVLGNLDRSFADFLSTANPVLTVFLGAAIGAGINLKDILLGGFSGILLGLIILLVSGPLVVLCDRIFNRRPGYAGWAVCATAGNTVAIPAAVALADPTFQPFVANATAQVAASMILTTVLVPVIAAWWGKKFGCPKYPKQEA